MLTTKHAALLLTVSRCDIAMRPSAWVHSAAASRGKGDGIGEEEDDEADVGKEQMKKTKERRLTKR